ncbi:hypothetical protein P280DRAFT_543148 [Massarina eburnea CBS 473.64]|uniref:Uncharacterized protein n=1 Tax=Massarina eburnea CBS 473.64 TaxID=1395130 RepID=A0A6A6S207_9PLEO|nr:hypothetical protein P280DRAFT_543148 [Massarina eburnea CBS 473.64]
MPPKKNTGASRSSHERDAKPNRSQGVFDAFVEDLDHFSQINDFAISNKERKRREKKAFAEARTGEPASRPGRGPASTSAPDRVSEPQLERRTTPINTEHTRSHSGRPPTRAPKEPERRNFDHTIKAAGRDDLSGKRHKDTDSYDPFRYTAPYPRSTNPTPMKKPTALPAPAPGRTPLPGPKPLPATVGQILPKDTSRDTPKKVKVEELEKAKSTSKPSKRQPDSLPKLLIHENTYGVVSLPETTVEAIEEITSSIDDSTKSMTSSTMSWEIINYAESNDEIVDDFVVIDVELPSADNGKTRWWKLGY